MGENSRWCWQNGQCSTRCWGQKLKCDMSLSFQPNKWEDDARRRAKNVPDRHQNRPEKPIQKGYLQRTDRIEKRQSSEHWFWLNSWPRCKSAERAGKQLLHVRAVRARAKMLPRCSKGIIWLRHDYDSVFKYGAKLPQPRTLWRRIGERKHGSKCQLKPLEVSF